MTLQLSSLKPFAQGGNRLCFVHPDDPVRCIKVRRPDFTLEDRRRKKGFPKNLRPLSSFDDNLEEYRVMRGLKKRFGDSVFDHVSHCYGFEQTDMGQGLVSELIRDADGRISQTLKKYIWDHGKNDPVQMAIKALSEFWLSECVPSRDLLLHNIVVQLIDTEIKRLVVIDGLGSAGLIPLDAMPVWIQRSKVKRKIMNFHQRIEQLLGQRGSCDFPGFHGLLIHDGLTEGPAGDSDPERVEQI